MFSSAISSGGGKLFVIIFAIFYTQLCLYYMFNFGDIHKMYKIKRRDEKKKEDKDSFVITDFVRIMSQKEYKKFQEQLKKENK